MLVNANKTAPFTHVLADSDVVNMVNGLGKFTVTVCPEYSRVVLFKVRLTFELMFWAEGCACTADRLRPTHRSASVGLPKFRAIAGPPGLLQ